jgi:hypothetical protein
MAGERIAARSRSPHPQARAGRSRSSARERAGRVADTTSEQPGRVLERISDRLLAELAERFKLASPPPAAGSP